MEIELKNIEDAAGRLKNVIHRTPIELSKTFSLMSSSQVYLKFENRQKTGSFKIRGAYNKIARLMENEKPELVVASSAGNHAQGVAYAASALQIKSLIVMPRSTPIAKVSATEGYGAEVMLYGDCYDDAFDKAMEICSQRKAAFIHPFDDPDVIAGQGTIGLEILEDLPTVDIVLVPAGGGGLLSGIALYLKSINPRIRIVGVEASGADAIFRSFKKKENVSIERVQTIADGIAVKRPGDLTMKIINRYVDEIVTVSDAEIADAILMLLERLKQVVEPAGAAALAAAINGKIDIKGKRVVCVLSGGNIDVSFIHRIIEKGLVKRMRQMKFSVVMLDVPGSLERFSRVVAGVGANIIMVQHDRLHADLNLNEAILHIACEVGGPAHGQALIQSLESEGYKVNME